MASIRPVQLPLTLSDSTVQGDTVSVPIDSSFPEQQADELAQLESFNKHLYRPNTYLHKWWARRSGTTFRHILKQVVTDPHKMSFYSPGGLEGKIILDPMMGGGTTLHEAIRLGANCIGIDIDPVPVLQVRASLQYLPLTEKQSVFKSFERGLRQAVGRFFMTHCPQCNDLCEIQYTLYALRRRCSCREVTLLDSFTLREDDSRPVNLCHTCREPFYGRYHSCRFPGQSSEQPELLVREQPECALCKTRFRDILGVPLWMRYTPVVIVGSCARHGLFHKSLDSYDQKLVQQANEEFEHSTQLVFSQFTISGGPKSRDLLARNVNSYLDLFTRRQLLYIEQAIRLLANVPSEHRLWLGLLVSTSLEFNSILCGYKGTEIRRPGAIRHVFSHHAYSFPYTALENNPLFTGCTSGTLQRLFKDRIVKASEWASMPMERRIANGGASLVQVAGEIDGGEEGDLGSVLSGGTRRFCIMQSDAGSCELPEGCTDYVVTDPPYYDSVQYSDLSEFFRVWLRQLLPDSANWTYDPNSSAVAGSVSGKEAYGEALTRIWTNCYRALKRPHGRLIFTFHHWNPVAWAELTISLKKAGFILKNRFAIFSENPISVHIRNLRALKHDCILVLQPSFEQDAVPQWPAPDKIDLTDSRRFCLDCGAALGFYLQSCMTDAAIRQDWRRLLKVERDG